MRLPLGKELAFYIISCLLGTLLAMMFGKSRFKADALKL